MGPLTLAKKLQIFKALKENRTFMDIWPQLMLVEVLNMIQFSFNSLRLYPELVASSWTAWGCAPQRSLDNAARLQNLCIYVNCLGKTVSNTLMHIQICMYIIVYIDLDKFLHQSFTIWWLLILAYPCNASAEFVPITSYFSQNCIDFGVQFLLICLHNFTYYEFHLLSLEPIPTLCRT